MLKLHKQSRTALRIVAILAAIVVLSFALQAAGHWHNQAYGDKDCRICHFAHSIAIDSSQGSALPLPAVVTWQAASRSIDPQLDLVFHQVSPRAPPA
jgi:hypothetical protein